MSARLERTLINLAMMLIGMCIYSILERDPPDPRIAKIENYPVANAEHRYVWSQEPCKFYDNGDEICPNVKVYQ